MNVKTSINLLQSELLPERNFLTLQNIAIGWVLALIATVTLGVSLFWQEEQLANEQKTLNTEKRQIAKTMESLEAQLARHKVDSRLVAKRDQLKAIMTNKNALIAQLTDGKKTEVVGFAKAMTELANFHSRNISLERAVLNNQHISFSGVAKSPDAVPQWLSGFEKSSLLSGQHFNHFELIENDNNYTQFSVSSDVNAQPEKLGESQ